jgi:hypothetical protein
MSAIRNVFNAFSNLAASVNALASVIDVATGRLRQQLALDYDPAVLPHNGAVIDGDDTTPAKGRKANRRAASICRSVPARTWCMTLRTSRSGWLMAIRSVVGPSIDMAPPWQGQRGRFYLGKSGHFYFGLTGLIWNILALEVAKKLVVWPVAAYKHW